jgi:hypothetical protein
MPPTKLSKEDMLLTAIVAGAVTLLVNVAAPWVLHLINPAGPKSSIVEANGDAIRTLPIEVREQFKKAVTFRSWLVNAFPLNTFPFQPLPGFPQPKQCLGQVLLDTGSLDDECGQRFSNWARQTADTNAANILALQTQVPPPPDRDANVNRLTEVQTNAAILADAIAKLKDTPASKSGAFFLNVVLLNDGDGDDVLYPDAWLSCKACAVEKVPLSVEERYITLKAHSFLPITCLLDSRKVSSEILKRLKDNVNASPNLSVNTCLHLASNRSLCHDGEIR